jgi:hypothetical protein
MEAEHRIGRDADLFARQHAEQHGAGRVAGAVDDHLLATLAHVGEARRVVGHQAAHVVLDSHGRVSGAEGQRRNEGAHHDCSCSHFLPTPHVFICFM